MKNSSTLIFIDTCSLLASCWDSTRRGSSEVVVANRDKENRFWGVLLPSLGRVGDLILTKRNYDELVKLSAIRHNSGQSLLNERCSHVLDRLRPLIENGYVSIVGDANDPFADAILLSAALKFRTQKNLLFITQDRALASDLIAISEFESVRPRGHQMKVRRLAKDGSIEKWHLRKSEASVPVSISASRLQQMRVSGHRKNGDVDYACEY